MELTRGTDHELVRAVQEQLSEAGFDPGEVTGSHTEQTRQAVADFQLQHGLNATGAVDESTLEALDIDVDPDETDVPEAEFERENFRYLLAKNPNYFGNVPAADFEAVEEIEANTFYEELTCVGYEPEAERLEAVVHVKQTYGYLGDICSAGTPEYVRFYVDWENNGNWTDVGVVSFTAYDIPGDKPLVYGVSLQVDAEEELCLNANLPEVRAILAWNQPPPANTPNFSPVWGNVLESRIQIDTRSLFSFGDLADEFDVQVPDELLAGIDWSQPLSFEAPSLGLTELASTYEDTSVPAKRYGFSHLTKSLSDPVTAGTLDDQALFDPFLETDIEFDPDDIVGDLLETEGDTYYEELDCVGLTRHGLNAVLTLKRPNGYSGGLCSAGSDEYVAFWEWDPTTSRWHHLGTTSVNVHDIQNLPANGLQYAAFLPASLGHRRQPCSDGPSTVRIRATLSWEVPPKANDPYWTPVWGNSMETLVHVPPGPAVEETTGFLETVGDMDTCDIDQDTGRATGPAVISGFTANDSPFGGEVTVTGLITNPPDVLQGETPVEYRVLVRPIDGTGSGAWRPLRNDLNLTVTRRRGTGPPTRHDITVTPDSDGFYEYHRDPPPNGWQFVAGRVLARWNTGGKEGEWEIKLEIKRPDEPPEAATVVECPDGTTRGTVVVRLDNTRPDAHLEITKVKPAGGSKQPANDCGKIAVGSNGTKTFPTVGDTIYGQYDASDEHFRRLSLGVRPGPEAAGATIDPASRAYPTYATGDSGTWKLETDGMESCGFTAHLDVDDRTIVNSGHIGWDAGDTVGFCLREQTETDGGRTAAGGATTLRSGEVEPLEGMDESPIVVTDHQFDAPGDDHENLNDEYVTLENTGDSDVDLTGWRIEDDAGRSYTFPDAFTLAPDETVTVRSGSGEDTDTDLHWGADRAVWDNTGDSVFLYGAEGTLVLKESY